MPDDEFLARIDAHMERGNEHMARGNEHMARGNVLMEEVREEVRLTREALVENRIFAQQMIMRLDRTVRDNAKAMDRISERMDRGTAELVRIGAEQREENRVGREALFAMIDRMNKLDPPDASG